MEAPLTKARSDEGKKVKAVILRRTWLLLPGTAFQPRYEPLLCPVRRRVPTGIAGGTTGGSPTGGA